MTARKNQNPETSYGTVEEVIEDSANHAHGGKPELRSKKESAVQEPKDKDAIGKISILILASLREVETEHEAADDLLDIRTQVVAALINYLETKTLLLDSRYRLGEVLSRYRVALPQGAWLPVVEVIARATGYTGRTIREVVADYARVQGVPAELIAELESVNIDPASKRHKKVVEMAEQGYDAGQPAQQAVENALASTQRLGLPRVRMTQDERWVKKLSRHILKGLERVPENRILDIFVFAAATAMGYKTPSRDLITIVPIEPTGNMPDYLSGKKRPPKGAVPDDPNQTEEQAAG